MSSSKPRLTYFESLSASILKACNENNVSELDILLNQLNEAANSSDSLNFLIGPVTKLLPCSNTRVKKTAYLIIPRICAVHPDAALLIANKVVQDTKDPNPAVKCFAVNAMSLIPQLHHDFTCDILSVVLNDGNPRVRLSAVTSCENVFKDHPELIKERGLLDRLYGCIRDSDPKVVVACLLVLDTILASEGGVVVNRSIAWYLLRRIADFGTPQLASVLQVLGKYKPSDEEELFQELSFLDPYLAHSSSSTIIVNCIQLFLKLTEDNYPQLKVEIIQRVEPVLKTYLCQKISKDSVNLILDFLLGINDSDSEWFQAFSDAPNLFYPKENADISIAIKQIKILPRLCNDVNFKDILKELDDNFCRNEHYCAHAVHSVCMISKKVQLSQSECFKVMLSLLDCSQFLVSKIILRAILEDFTLLDIKNDEKELLFTKLLSKVNFSEIHSIPREVPLLLGKFGHNIHVAPYVLETLAADFDCYDKELKSVILTCVVKLYLHRPPKYQHILGTVLEKCIGITTGNGIKCKQLLELQDKAVKYYCLLKYDVNLMAKILSV